MITLKAKGGVKLLLNTQNGSPGVDRSVEIGYRNDGTLFKGAYTNEGWWRYGRWLAYDKSEQDTE